MSRVHEDGTFQTRLKAALRIFKEIRQGKPYLQLQILNAKGQIIQRTEIALDLPEYLDEEMRVFIEDSLESGARKAAMDWIRREAP